MSDDLKNFRQLLEKSEELLFKFEDIHKLIINDCVSMINTYIIESTNAIALKHSVNKTLIDVNKVANKITTCQNTQENLVSKIENDLHHNLITKFTPEFSEKVVDKLILNELNKFEIKLNSVLKSSNDLIEKSTDLQNDYIKNKDDICSSVGAIIDIINNTKEEFEKDYEKLKIDFRSASNSHQNNLIKYQKDINTLLKAEFKKINILKTISIVSSSTFVGMTLMYFLFPFLH